jgi:hypothetical protein
LRPRLAPSRRGGVLVVVVGGAVAEAMGDGERREDENPTTSAAGKLDSTELVAFWFGFCGPATRASIPGWDCLGL